MKKLDTFFKKNFLIFITYAFIGWIYEVMWFIFMRGKFVNRGFLNGPYLPIYGFGALILYYMLRNFMKKKHKVGKLNINLILVFIIIFIVTTVVEFIAHYILDTYFNIVLWDYSKDYLNIDGRVCFAASRNFAIGGTAGLYLIQPLIEKIFNKFKNNKIFSCLIYILFIIIVIDLIITLL